MRNRVHTDITMTADEFAENTRNFHTLGRMLSGCPHTPPMFMGADDLFTDEPDNVAKYDGYTEANPSVAQPGFLFVNDREVPVLLLSMNPGSSTNRDRCETTALLALAHAYDVPVVPMVTAVGPFHRVDTMAGVWELPEVVDKSGAPYCVHVPFRKAVR